MFKKTFIAETKAVEGNDLEMTVRISTASPDRSNDIVQPSGVLLENYLKNPVVAAFHRYDQPAIANAKSIEVKDDAIDAVIEWVEPGTYELADTLRSQYKAGKMRAWSIGFVPKEYEPRENAGYGFIFKKWELLEFSAVLVPDNQDALTIIRSKGFDVPVEQNDFEILQTKIAALEAKIADLQTQLSTAIKTEEPAAPAQSDEVSGIAKLAEELKAAEASYTEALNQLYTALKN